jgi:hypothetical protein
MERKDNKKIIQGPSGWDYPNNGSEQKARAMKHEMFVSINQR